MHVIVSHDRDPIWINFLCATRKRKWSISDESGYTPLHLKVLDRMWFYFIR